MALPQSTIATLTLDPNQTEALTLRLQGQLDAYSTGACWRQAMILLQHHQPKRLHIDASHLEYCDGAGVALLLELESYQQEQGAEFLIQGLRPEFQQLVTLYVGAKRPPKVTEVLRTRHLAEEVGRFTVDLWQDLLDMVSFIGELALAWFEALVHPSRLRWRDSLRVAELAGVNALPIITLVGFLMGLIMAFQSAIPMRQFGAEIFVADLVGLSMFRELGPLMTAVVLAGRSGSAFAAELGTMRVNEEIDALTTMGLEPVRFLVLPRVFAVVCITPLLSIFASLAGLVGGALVMMSLGYPPIAYLNEMLTEVTYVDILGGLVKALVFGLLVATIGCLRGLKTGTGASAVGSATTGAVVSGILLVAIVDGLFAILYHFLDI